MAILEAASKFVANLFETSASSARLLPGQRIALNRQFGIDSRPRDRDDDERDDPSMEQSASRRKILHDLMTIDMDRKRRLQSYEEMDKSDIASAAVDMFAEDATPIDPDTDRTVWIDADSNAVKEAAEEVLENLDIEDEILSIARNIALYGESFERLIYESQRGVRAFFHVPAGSIKRYEDRYRVLLGFTQEGLKYTRENQQGKKLSEPWDYIHFRMWRHRSNPYGISVLQNAIRPWRQIILGEDQALMYRLMRAPDRFAFFVDTGGQGEVDAWRSLQRFRRRHKKMEFEDPTSGRYDHRYNPITPTEDLYIAVNGKDSGTRVEKMFGSSNQNDVTDLIYYIRKFCAAVRVPPEFLGFNYPEVKTATSFETKSSLANQSRRYANAVAKLQRAVREGIRHTIEVHLRLKAANPEDKTFDFDLPENSFRVMMAPVTQLDDIDRLDANTVRTTLVNSMLQLGLENEHFDLYNWTLWTLKKVYRIGDEELQTLVTKNPENREFAKRDGNLTPAEAAIAKKVIAFAAPLIERHDGRTLSRSLPKRITGSVTEEDVEREQEEFTAATTT